MQAVLPVPVPRRHLVPAAMSRPWVAVTLGTLVLTALLLAVLPRPLSPDISGQLWIADRMRHGARLYLDIAEINPPLWFWMAMPVNGLAELLGVPPEHVLIATIGGAALASLLATNALLGQVPPALRTVLLLYGACILLVMPLRDLGQREHLALIGALPYVALIAARREGRRVPAWLALLVGCGAAAGFALKHYFVAVPLLLELWLVLALRRGWRPLRPELLVLLAGAAGYAAAIVVLTPAYLRVTVPELALAYGAFGAPSLSLMIRPAQPIWVLMLCGIVAQRSVAQRPLPPLATALLIAAGGFFAAWLIQHKGWPYQGIATTGMLALALAMALPCSSALPSPPDGAAPRPRLVTLAGLVAAVLLFAAPTQWVPTPETDLAPALAGLNAGDAVAIVSKEGRTAWPTTVGRGLRFPGRRTSFWILAAVDANAAGANDPRIAALGRSVVHESVLGYRCLPPRRIVFSPGRAASTVTAASDNPLGYFLRDPQFVALLRHYRRLDLPGAFDAFQLSRPLAPQIAAGCPRGL